MRGRAALALVLLLAAAPAAPADPPLVLFDEAHGQRFLLQRDGALDLSRLGEAFRRTGARVESSTVALSPEALAVARAVVVSGAFAAFAATEQDALLAFLDRGGSVAVMLHIGPPAAELLAKLGVAISNGVIRESDGILHGNPVDFRASRLARHPLTRGLAGVSLYGAWALLPESPRLTALVETQPHAWVDLNHSGRYDAGDAMQAFTVAIAGERGAGRFVVFGDDAMFQNRFLEEGRENRELATNLAGWLLGAPGDGVVARNDELPAEGAALRAATR